MSISYEYNKFNIKILQALLKVVTCFRHSSYVYTIFLKCIALLQQLPFTSMLYAYGLLDWFAVTVPPNIFPVHNYMTDFNDCRSMLIMPLFVFFNSTLIANRFLLSYNLSNQHIYRLGLS